ncbi:hypothetical protein NDU88_001096 [Pleurodeles waltl]|uniref:Uncharacterized protein n=1 Tax=Pleurodeles waltl TaxID=8319 RepID=A0AAV7P354_PLEWA|nr:hypothetical protein NDU88_001096 [Pleurodeles waltl]
MRAKLEPAQRLRPADGTSSADRDGRKTPKKKTTNCMDKDSVVVDDDDGMDDDAPEGMVRIVHAVDPTQR